MIKMYLRQDIPGCSPEWEENWKAGRFEQSVRFCAVDPLRPLFEKYSQEGSLLLEGGCGLGQYLAYYNWRGRRVIGVDFARQALKMLRLRQPRTDLSVGDVSMLPFADATFDLYYSGGVVEHFEHGATESLKEAKRVLKPDGTLLISVPYLSPIRRMLLPFKGGDWRRVDRAELDPEGSQSEKRFYQYVYTTEEFEQMLRGAGLRVLEKQGYALVWGAQRNSVVERRRRAGTAPRVPREPWAGNTGSDQRRGLGQGPTCLAGQAARCQRRRQRTPAGTGRALHALVCR